MEVSAVVERRVQLENKVDLVLKERAEEAEEMAPTAERVPTERMEGRLFCPTAVLMVPMEQLVPREKKGMRELMEGTVRTESMAPMDLVVRMELPERMARLAMQRPMVLTAKTERMVWIIADWMGATVPSESMVAEVVRELPEGSRETE